jgi:hypothetical protein
VTATMSASESLAARAEALPPGSTRRLVLEGARRFKSAWVEFARLLSEVRRGELWREWGYPGFDRYCSSELFIRRATAEKLTASFGFLERHEPRLAQGLGDEKAPPFEVIEVLSRAEAAGRLSSDGWRELREEVIDRSPTAAALTRTLAEKFGPEPRAPRPPRGERLGRLAAAARRMAEACGAEAAVPRALAARAEALADELQELARGA